MRSAIFASLLCIAALVPSISAAPAPKAGLPRVLVVGSNKTGNWEIYLVQPGTGETKQLTDKKGNNTEPIWAPDGKRIAFVSDRSGDRDIWLMNADGTEPEQLTKKSGGCTNLRWSPDGKLIAFVGPKAGRDQIQTAEVATGKIAQLTDATTPSRQPAWAPDGKKLSFSSFAGRNATYTMNADGTEKTKLTENQNDVDGGLDAAWAPDGKHLAFVASTYTDAGWRVYTIGANGKNQKQITTSANTYGNVYPQWSPDGTHISFGELVDDVLQVAVMRPDGSGAKVITSKHLHAYTRWSPDGKSISYTRYEKGKAATLWVSDPDGENAREVIRNVGNPAAEWKPK